MRSLIVGIVLALALPNAALAKGKHKKARAHAAKKVKQSKRARLAHKQDVMPVSAVEPMAAAEPARAPEPAPAPAAKTQSASLEPVLGHKTAAVTPHEASNFATQATDDESPKKK
jgi:hypothetical protein